VPAAAAAACTVAAACAVPPCHCLPTSFRGWAPGSAEEKLLAQKAAITNWAAWSEANDVVGWDESTPVCQWTGVSCGNQTILDM